MILQPNRHSLRDCKAARNLCRIDIKGRVPLQTSSSTTGTNGVRLAGVSVWKSESIILDLKGCSSMVFGCVDTVFVVKLFDAGPSLIRKHPLTAIVAVFSSGSSRGEDLGLAAQTSSRINHFPGRRLDSRTHCSCLPPIHCLRSLYPILTIASRTVPILRNSAPVIIMV